VCYSEPPLSARMATAVLPYTDNCSPEQAPLACRWDTSTLKLWRCTCVCALSSNMCYVHAVSPPRHALHTVVSDPRQVSCPHGRWLIGGAPCQDPMCVARAGVLTALWMEEQPEVVVLHAVLVPEEQPGIAEHIAPETRCCICLSAGEEKGPVRKIACCAAEFHRACLSRWIECGKAGVHPVCPCCRARLVNSSSRLFQ
jgi:hypothetical protein